jgi:1-acyl-sn-glycerol-3-phosphate acyltransferase
VPTLIAAIRSIATYVSVSLYVLLVGTPCVLLALALGNPAILYRVGDLGVRLGLFLSGITFTVEGREHINPSRAAVYAVNHASNVEPPILFTALRSVHPRLRILYKAELRKLPILNLGFDLVGFIPIDRGNREQTTRAVNAAVARLNAGGSFFVFPEGTRSRTGELLPFRKGAFVMAIRAGVPVVPIAISGARDAMRKGSSIIRPATVRLRLGPPIETRDLGDEGRDGLVHSVRAEVQRLLA